MKTFTVYRHPYARNYRVKFFDRYIQAKDWDEAKTKLKPNESIGGEHVVTIPLKDE